MSACAAAEPGDTTVLSADDPAVKVLDELEARGSKLRSFQARLKYTREQGLLGDSQLRIGSIDYHAGESAKFAIRFTHLVVDNALREKRSDYIFDGQWLAEVNIDEKQFIRRQIVAPGETYDPLKIGEGPFPFPIGQKRDEVLRQFTAKVIAPNEDDPANTRHLQLKPRTHPETGKPTSEFTTVDIWYGTESLLPVKIVTYEEEADNTTIVELVDAKVDAIDDKAAKQLFDTATPPVGSGWRVEVKPLERATDKPKADK
jgi:hypothetical protein